MKNKEVLKEFQHLKTSEILDKVDSLRKELFDLRFKQATRQLSETHQFKIIKKKIAQLLTIYKNQSLSQKSTD